VTAKKKRHHYIPRFYLEGFVDPLNKPYIWVYEKGNPNIIKATAENVAVRKHYYSFVTAGGNEDSFEDIFGIVSGIAKGTKTGISGSFVNQDRA
jgi:hypothetical protein